MPAPCLPALQPGARVDKWTVSTKLGEGGFGAVYKVSDGTGVEHALKIESVQIKFQVLRMEVAVLEQLQNARTKHFCAIYGKGLTDQFSYVVMTLVSSSLQDLRKARKEQHFTLNTAIRVGVQCLEALEDMHRIGYLHRDVKPGNYAVGRAEAGESRVVYILDFGMCRKYLAQGRIRTPREKAAFRGTVRYAALACHRSKELSAKDDVEAWFYQQIEMTKGAVPWKHLLDKDEVQVWKEQARQPGHNVRTEMLKMCPPEYETLFKHLEKLDYYDLPNYALCYSTLRAIAARLSLPETGLYDWEEGRSALAPVKRAIASTFTNAPPPSQLSVRTSQRSRRSMSKRATHPAGVATGAAGVRR